MCVCVCVCACVCVCVCVCACVCMHVQMCTYVSPYLSCADRFKFTGRIIGLTIAQGYLLDVFFTRPVYKNLLNR